MCTSHACRVRALYPRGVPFRRRHAYRLLSHGADVGFFLRRFISDKDLVAASGQNHWPYFADHVGWARGAPHAKDCGCAVRFALSDPVPARAERLYARHRKQLQTMLDVLNVPY